MKTKHADGMLDFDEAIELVMERTGKTRRQARIALIEKCRQGFIPATGINTATGEREEIPASAWPVIQ